MMKLKFFTDKTVKNEFLLIKVKDYIKLKKNNPVKLRKYKEVLIDPGVYELVKNSEYSWVNNINILDFLDSLPENHFFSADYPPDMNIEFEKEFIEKTWNNALKYCNHKQYICAVQYKLNNYWDFTYWFDKYTNLLIKSNFIALGNMCRIITKSQFIYHALDYAFKNCRQNKIHIYGLSLRYIPYAYKISKRFNIQLSIDSTKWTRISSGRELREIKGYCAAQNNEDRQLFFNDYLKNMIGKGVKLENIIIGNKQYE